MENIVRKSKIIFPILAFISAVLGGYVSHTIMKDNPDVHQAKEMLKQTGSEGISAKLLDMSLSASILVNIVSTAVAVGIVYIICRLVYKKINKDNEEMMSDFNTNHFAIMSFKYIGIIIVALLSLILQNSTSFILSIVLGAIKIMLTIAGANYVFSEKRYENLKYAPNMILYVIVGILG